MRLSFKGKKYQWSFIKFIINVLIFVAILTVFISYLSRAAKATSEKHLVYFTVHRGDSLWSIAKEVAPDRDPRTVIREIKQKNGLGDSHIQVGDQLAIEIQSAD